MLIANLKNISINERTTMNGDTYFVIKDNDQNQVKQSELLIVVVKVGHRREVY